MLIWWLCLCWVLTIAAAGILGGVVRGAVVVLHADLAVGGVDEILGFDIRVCFFAGLSVFFSLTLTYGTQYP